MSETRRSNHCTPAGCRCNADPPASHDPYWQRPAKVDGKTVTKRLISEEARPYQKWIGNDLRLPELPVQICTVGAKVGELLLKKEVSGKGNDSGAD